MSAFDTVVGSIAKVLGYLAGGAALLMMLHMVADATMRTLFGTPIIATNEYVQYWYMVLIGIGGWALAQVRGQHIDAPLLFDRVHPKVQSVWVILGGVITIVFLIVLAYSSWGNAMHALEVKEFAGGYGTLIWPMKFLVPVSSVLMALVVASELVKVISRMVRGGDAQLMAGVHDNDVEASLVEATEGRRA